jgi:hypothetical protein
MAARPDETEFWVMHAEHSTYWTKRYLQQARDARTQSARDEMLGAARYQLGERRRARRELLAQPAILH